MITGTIKVPNAWSSTVEIKGGQQFESIKFAEARKVMPLSNESTIKVGERALIVWDAGNQDLVDVKFITESGYIGYTLASDHVSVLEVECRKISRFVDSFIK